MYYQLEIINSQGRHWIETSESKESIEILFNSSSPDTFGRSRRIKSGKLCISFCGNNNEDFTTIKERPYYLDEP